MVHISIYVKEGIIYPNIFEIIMQNIEKITLFLTELSPLQNGVYFALLAKFRKWRHLLC